MKPKPFRVIPCAEWGARHPRSGILPVYHKPSRALFHHTAGHFAELDHTSGESYAEAAAYVRALQNFHMRPESEGGRGWVDTGQNFTVTRNGYIFEGRHRSLEMVAKGKMVVSAHCPNQNDQPGVEIEHVDPEGMTPIQHAAAVWLFAWLCKCGDYPASHIYGHRDYYATACPGALYGQLPQFRLDVAKALKPKWLRPYNVVKVVAGRLVRVGR